MQFNKLTRPRCSAGVQLSNPTTCSGLDVQLLFSISSFGEVCDHDSSIHFLYTLVKNSWLHKDQERLVCTPPRDSFLVSQSPQYPLSSKLYFAWLFYSKFNYSFYLKICAKYHFFCYDLFYQYKFFKNNLNLTMIAQIFWIRQLVKLEIKKSHL